MRLHCARPFNALSGTPLVPLRLRAKWTGQAEALGTGSLSTRQSSDWVWRKAPPLAGSTASVPVPRTPTLANFWASPKPMSPTSWFHARGSGRLRTARRRGEKLWVAARLGAHAGPDGSVSNRGVGLPYLEDELSGECVGSTHVSAATRPSCAKTPTSPWPLQLRRRAVHHQAMNVSRVRRVKAPW